MRQSYQSVRRSLAVLVTVAVVASGVVLGQAGAAGAATINETEPNGTTATANALPVGTTVAGSTTSGGGSDSDYFSFVVPSTSQLSVAFTFPTVPGTDKAYDFAIYDFGGNTRFDFDLFAGDNAGTRLAETAMYLPAGTYFVEVYGTNSRPSWGKSYSLTLGLTAGSFEAEPNASTSAATPLAIGTTVSGSTLTGGGSDSDYYSFVVPATSQVSVAFTFPTVPGTDKAYDFTIYDFSGTTRFDFDLFAGDNAGARLAGTAMYLPAGTYFIEVYGTSSRPSWGKAYSLTVGLTPGSFESEPNDGTAKATPIAIGVPVGGSTLSGGGSDSDYFSFVVPTTSQVSVAFTFPTVPGTDKAYDFVIYDFGGNTRFDFDLFAGDNAGGRLASTAMYLPAGTYFLEIYGTSSRPSWGKAYALALGLTPGAFEAEPNDGTATATPLAFGATLTGSTLSGGGGDSDYYVVNVSKKKRIQIAIGRASGLGSGSGYSVELYNYAGTSLGSWSVSGNGVGAPTPVTVPRGTYYVSVYGSSSSTSWGKSYTVKVGYPFAKAATPKITGKVKVGHKVTAKFKKWGPGKVAMSYQWLRSGKPIAGATAKSYKLTAKDRGKRITVRIVGKKANYITLQKTSSATKKVARK